MSERFPDIDWYCDHCNAYLNDQAGFVITIMYGNVQNADTRIVSPRIVFMNQRKIFVMLANRNPKRCYWRSKGNAELGS